MTTTRAALLTDVRRRLGDSGAMIWTSDELITYMQRGYDELTAETGCLWETGCLPDYAFAFNYTQPFELEYIQAESSWLIAGMAQFTCLEERNYVDNGDGPANHTAFWEFNSGLVSETVVAAVSDLPANLNAIERATWNTKRIDALRSRDLERQDSRYELNAGEVLAYLRDKDGVDRFRKWRVPSTAYTPYSKTAASSEYGILRRAGDVSTETVIGVWGVLRRIPGQHPIGGPWGNTRTVYKEANNVRLEYQRRGADLSVNQAFEISDRYVKYIRHFVMWRALSRDGKGQDLQLADHYRLRYAAGVERISRRRQAVQFQKSYRLGGSGTRGSAPPRARLPWQYGKVVR